jgi:hypothetical protein
MTQVHRRMAVARQLAVRLALAGSLLCTLLAGAEPAAAASPVPSLFEAVASTPASSPGAATAAQQRGRRRAIKVRRGVLTQADGSSALGVGQRIGLNLFEDASFTLNVTDVSRNARGGRTWSGALEGVDLGHAVLAVQDGALVGTVIMPGAVYSIDHEPDGRQVVEEVDIAALPNEAHAVSSASRRAAADTLVGAELPTVAADTAAQIDVMVLYTPAARAAAGGTAAMRAGVEQAVALTNLAYANNGLVQRVRLVFTGEVAMTEHTGFNGIDEDLDDLTFNNPTVAWLRNVTRADLVSLITHRVNPVFCGIGFLMGPGQNSATFAAFGYSVVERICASGNLSFAHELAHNMGAHHDTFVTVGDPTLFPYSHGYVDLVGKFRTIMAYVDQCDAAGFVCNKIVYFSSPDGTSGGRPIGNPATADNARTLSETASTVANFRQALVPPPTASAAVNQVSFTPGETVVTSVVLDNPGMTGDADLYLGLLLPGGGVLFFTDPGGSTTAVGTTADLRSFRPIASGVPLSTAFSINVPSFVSYQWTGTEPRGGYVFFLLVVRAGALLDGVLSSSELLGASLTPFAVP